MEQYRKLTDAELKALYKQLAGKFSKTTALQESIIKHVKKYYPKNAASAILTTDSGYNDEYYNPRAEYLTVYDKDGVEIVPLPETAKKSRQEWQSFDMPQDLHEPIEEEITVFISGAEIPDLYIKK